MDYQRGYMGLYRGSTGIYHIKLCIYEEYTRVICGYTVSLENHSETGIL